MMKKIRYTTIRISGINKNWLELERMLRKKETLDDAISEIREYFIKRNKKKDYVFHL